ncbi:MAG: hypothetical protein ACR2HJ_03925 [Fimbriimonadales bacterium]
MDRWIRVLALSVLLGAVLTLFGSTASSITMNSWLRFFVLSLLVGAVLVLASLIAVHLPRCFFSKKGRTCDAQEDQLDEAAKVRSRAKSTDIGRVLVDLGYIGEDERSDDKRDTRSD